MGQGVWPGRCLCQQVTHLGIAGLLKALVPQAHGIEPPRQGDRDSAWFSPSVSMHLLVLAVVTPQCGQGVQVLLAPSCSELRYLFERPWFRKEMRGPRNNLQR